MKIIDDMNNSIVSILGTTYSIEFRSEDKDSKLNNFDGYIDSTIHKIVIRIIDREDDTVDDLEIHYKRVLRHEILHGFLLESGLNSECDWHTEEMVDWFALQADKIYRCFSNKYLI